MNSKKKARKKLHDRRMTEHHMFPRSRGGSDKKSNKVLFPQCYHDNWHDALGNLTPQESIKYIEIIFFGKGRKRRKYAWTKEDLYELQLELQRETHMEDRRRKGKSSR